MKHEIIYNRFKVIHPEYPDRDCCGIYQHLKINNKIYNIYITKGVQFLINAFLKEVESADSKIILFDVAKGNFKKRCKELLDRIEKTKNHPRVIVIHCVDDEDVDNFLDQLDPERKVLMNSRHLFNDLNIMQ